MYDGVMGNLVPPQSDYDGRGVMVVSPVQICHH